MLRVLKQFIMIKLSNIELNISLKKVEAERQVVMLILRNGIPAFSKTKCLAFGNVFIDFLSLFV